MKYDYIVIGAGVAGLSFTALMEKKGCKIALLEAHSLPGGCASYFERNGNIFDVGATTLSGLLPERSIDYLIKELPLNLDIRKIYPGLVVLSNGKRINRFADLNQWIRELNTHFPQIDHHKFWALIKKIDDSGWSLSTNLSNIPLRTMYDLSEFKIKNTFLGIKLFPFVFNTVANYLEKIDDPEYLAIINELLFITAQNNAAGTPMLMGAMGLNYPSDTNYVMGGMKAFSDALANQCSNLIYRNQVISISPINHGKAGFSVQTKNGPMLCNKIVSTLPIWNHANMFSNDKQMTHYFNEQNIFKSQYECWSAFTLYLTIPKSHNRASLYYQVHCDSIPNCETHSFFVSFSHPSDLQRTKNQEEQTVTISTHTKPQFWLDLPREDYKRKKNETTEFILKAFCTHFSLNFSDLQNILSGSPSTFIRYTSRSQGLVGGIPHSINQPLSKLLFNFSPMKNLYLIGDTQFPGQGIGAVALGAKNLVTHLAHE